MMPTARNEANEGSDRRYDTSQANASSVHTIHDVHRTPRAPAMQNMLPSASCSQPLVVDRTALYSSPMPFGDDFADAVR